MVLVYTKFGLEWKFLYYHNKQLYNLHNKADIISVLELFTHVMI